MAYDSGGVADGKPVVGDILYNHGAGSDKCPATNGDARNDYCTRSEGRTSANTNRAELPIVRTLEAAIRIDGAGKLIVRQAHVGSDEDPVLKFGARIYGGVVLDFDTVANPYVLPHIGTFSDYALFSQDRSLPNLGKVPNFGPSAKPGVGCDEGRWMDGRLIAPHNVTHGTNL